MNYESKEMLLEKIEELKGLLELATTGQQKANILDEIDTMNFCLSELEEDEY